MKKLTFVTGNIHKANLLQQSIGFPISHHEMDLTEIQSLDLKEIITHKVEEAYSILKTPVLVHDTALYFNALGHLPGPFIKWFSESIGNDGLCQILNNFTDRSAFAVVNLGFYDGEQMRIFEERLDGRISDNPSGNKGFGWDPIFIPEGFDKTRADLNSSEYEENSLTHKVAKQAKIFLEQKYA
jgi:non-canonical purine NTP pyrophosphatase (RdgB/HAM1 family)